MDTNLDNFKNYCEEYQNTFSPGTDFSKKHDALVKKILREPTLIQLNDVQFRYREVKLIGEDKSGRIDLVFITDEEIPYICEVKASSRAGMGTETQLERYYEYIRDNFKIFPTRIDIRLDKTGRLTKRIIPMEIEDLLESISKKMWGDQDETRIF